MPQASLALLALAALLFGRSALAQLPVSLPAEPPPLAPRAGEPAATAEPPAAPGTDAGPAPVAEPPVTTPAETPAPRAVTEPAPVRATQLVQAAAPREAEEAREADAELEAAPRRKWYGWQTVAADGVSVLTLLFAEKSNDKTLLWAGILGYEFAPGILHFVHRNPGRAFASFGLRLGMPLAGAVLGASTAAPSSYCDDSDCREDRAAAGFLLGMAGAMALDAAVFAYESPRRRPRVTLAPLLQLSSQRAWLGVGGEL